MQSFNPAKKGEIGKSACFILLAGIALYSCQSSGGETGGYQMPTPSLPVITVNNMTATVHREYPASVQGIRDVEIRPQVDGYLTRIYIDEGAYVHKGQPLFSIDDRPYREQLNTAKAGLGTAKANLASAEINLAKVKPLVENNVVSDVQLKTAQATYDAAVASVAQAAAMVQSAQINVGYTEISAPVDGYIGRIPLKTGSLVGRATPEALTVISEIKDVYAYYSLSENEFLLFKNQFEGNTVEEKIKNMPPVELVLADGSIYPSKGRVQIVAGQFDNSIGAISFRAVFPNPDRLLRSGSTGKVRIPKILENALVVPQESTFEIQDKVFVFALADSNKVVSKPVVVSGKTARYYFVEYGLQAGENIVFTGVDNLRDGMMIIPQHISADSLFKVKPL